MATARVGMAGWTYAPWRGGFYPAGLRQADELRYAAERVTSIEPNGSFYALQKPASWRAWHDATPDDFVFAVKAPRFITHIRRLEDVAEPVANFFASGILGLGPKLARATIDAMIDPTAPSPFVLPEPPAELRLETDRLLVRPVEEADFAAMARYRGDPEVCRFLPFPPQSVDDIRARLGPMLGSTSLAGEPGGVPVAIVRRDDGALIGDLVLFHLDAVHGTVEIGWVIHPEVTGRGYAVEACRALIDAAFRIFGVRRVVARIDAENTASARLAERLGMRCEARLIENEWYKGRWSDELDYAILAREWPS